MLRPPQLALVGFSFVVSVLTSSSIRKALGMGQTTKSIGPYLILFFSPPIILLPSNTTTEAIFLGAATSSFSSRWLGRVARCGLCLSLSIDVCECHPVCRYSRFRDNNDAFFLLLLQGRMCRHSLSCPCEYKAKFRKHSRNVATIAATLQRW